MTETTTMLQAVVPTKKRGIAVSGKRPGVRPTALREHRSMTEYEPNDDSSDAECPTCGRDDFASRYGMKHHHSRAHNESLSGAIVECSYCGSSVRKEMSDISRNGSHFCDNSCYSEHLSEVFVGESNPRWNSVEIECEWCNKTYTTTSSKATDGNHNFCCKSCWGAWASENLSGENSPYWKGGTRYVEVYGGGFDERKTARIRERDGKQCQACGKSQSAHIDECGQRLEVHHIRKARSFDDPEKRDADSNLVTLCISCHRRWEGIPLRPQLD